MFLVLNVYIKEPVIVRAIHFVIYDIDNELSIYVVLKKADISHLGPNA